MPKTHKRRSFLLWVALAATVPVCSRVTPTMAATQAEIQEWLQVHNNYRILHNVPTVTWSQTVAAGAQAFADTCPTSHSGSGYGENIAWAAPASYNPGINTIVKWWYDEEPLYDYNNPGFSPETGHFTQVVWKKTREIGCGFTTGCTTPGRANVWICQYNPPGNYLGEFAENVFPPDNGSNPATTTLTNTIPVNGLKGEEGNRSYFSLNVPGTADKLDVQIFGGTGDADLYIRHGSLPDDSGYDCRPRLDGNEEHCGVKIPEAGTYYIMIRAYASYSGLTLLGIHNGATVIVPELLLLLK